MVSLVDVQRKARVELILRSRRRAKYDGDIPPDGVADDGTKYEHPAPPRPRKTAKPKPGRNQKSMTDAELLDELRTQDWDSRRFRAAMDEVGARDRALWDRAYELLGERETQERDRDRAQADEERRLESTRELIAGRDDGESAMRRLRGAYVEWVAEQMRNAEAHIIGYELNERGIRAGVAPIQVWTSRRDFERYASRELRDYVEAHPDVWKTFTEWRQQYAPVLQPGRRRSPRRRDADTPVAVALPGLTGRPAGRSIRP